jgi:uncharacterized protein with PIN domain
MTATATADEPTTQPAATGHTVRCPGCGLPLGETERRAGRTVLRIGGVIVGGNQRVRLECAVCGRSRHWRGSHGPQVEVWKLRGKDHAE